MTEEKLLTPEDVAKRLQVSPHTVIDYLRKGRLKGIKLAKHWRIREEELQRFLTAHERDGTAEEGHDG
jgi:excisionase family DNA binding protein